ncbi:MAG: apolipoprotein N-acyltransferase [Clostridia bacterium]|nr:apolipoprotein N-acyltransferase [Clostridia bacterium]
MITKKEKAIKLPSALLRFFLYALCGILSGLPVAVPAFWPLGWLAPIPVLFSEIWMRPKKDRLIFAYGRGFLYFWVFGVTVFFWFTSLYPLDFLGFDKASAAIVVILACCGIPMLQATVSGLLFVIICIMRRIRAFDRHPFLSAVATALLFPVFEYFHTLTWAGVPWGKLAVGQTGCLYIVQSVSLFGSYFITLIIYAFSALAALGIKYLIKGDRHRAAICAVICAAVFLSNLLFGAVYMTATDTSLENEDKITASAIQGNIRFEDKWGDKEWHTMELYKRLTLEASDNGAQLIVWPETAIPYDYSFNPRMERLFKDLSAKTDAEILVTFFESENGCLYNSARLLDSKGVISEAAYKKRHLVPFGEYTPLEELINTLVPPLAEMSAIADPLSPGNSTAIMETQNGRLGTLICFDSIYEALCLESVRDGAELIAVSTNDSWFSQSTALGQHNAHSQLRAIEHRRYVVRSANTGISSIITPTGHITDSLGDGLEGFVTGQVSYLGGRTLYTSIGNIIVPLCALLSCAFIIFTLTEKGKAKK